MTQLPNIVAKEVYNKRFVELSNAEKAKVNTYIELRGAKAILTCPETIKHSFEVVLASKPVVSVYDIYEE